MAGKEERARLSGMSYALRIAKEKGVDGLEADLKMRGALGLPVGAGKKELSEFTVKVKNNVLDTVLIMACMVLRDEFDFGAKRVQRFIDRFNLKAACLADDYVEWKDIQETLQKELGIDLRIRWNE